MVRGPEGGIVNDEGGRGRDSQWGGPRGRDSQWGGAQR